MSIHTQFDNVGDALINRELALALADRAPTWIDLSRAPAAFAATMGIDAHPSTRPLRRFGYARLILTMLGARLRGRECHFFLNPGGLGVALNTRKALAMVVNNLILSALALAGVRLALVGVSFQTMTPRDSALWRWRAKLLRTFIVRDDISRSLLEGQGFPSPGRAPDLSFALPGRLALPADGLKGRDAIAFSFRLDKAYAQQSVAINALVDNVIDAAGPDRPIMFIAQVGRDAAPMAELHERVRSRIGDRASLHVATDSIESALTLYGSCAALHSNRLHALLLAAFAGAAPCAVIRRTAVNKFEGILGDLGVADQICWLDEAGALPVSPVPVERIRMMDQTEELNRMFDILLLTRNRPDRRSTVIAAHMEPRT